MELNNQRIIEWDVLNWSRSLDFWENYIQDYIPSETKVLALGERNGGLSLWLASKGFNVVCSDYGGIQAEVQNAHMEYKGHQNIEYCDVDIFKIPFENEKFDIVIAKSVIGGLKLVHNDKNTRSLENQKLALTEIFRILKKGGVFLGAENLVGHYLINKIRNLYKSGNIGWRHLKPTELMLLLENFSERQYEYFGLVPGLFKCSFINLVIYKLNVLLNQLLTENNKYICFFCARK